MAIVINGSGTITGISTGGLPDGIVDDGTLATSAVTSTKIADGTITNADINASAAIAGSKVDGSFGKVLQDGYAINTTSLTTSGPWGDIVSLSMSGLTIGSRLYIWGLTTMRTTATSMTHPAFGIKVDGVLQGDGSWGTGIQTMAASMNWGKAALNESYTVTSTSHTLTLTGRSDGGLSVIFGGENNGVVTGYTQTTIYVQEIAQ